MTCSLTPLCLGEEALGVGCWVLGGNGLDLAKIRVEGALLSGQTYNVDIRLRFPQEHSR